MNKKSISEKKDPFKLLGKSKEGNKESLDDKLLSDTLLSDDKRVDDIMRGAERFIDEWPDFYSPNNYANPIDYEKVYAFAREICADIDFIKVDIGAFAMRLDELRKFGDFSHIGMYMSALLDKVMRECDSVVLDITWVSKEDSSLSISTDSIDHLCYRHSKGNVEIIGDVGRDSFQKMIGGKVNVKGRCGEQAGYEMIGGEVRISGKCSEYPGEKMSGGSILIDGDCSGYAGTDMSGGTIQVNGYIGGYAGKRQKGGKIILNGKYVPNTIGEDMEGGAIELNGGSKEDLLEIDVSTMKGGELYHNGKRIYPLKQVRDK